MKLYQYDSYEQYKNLQIAANIQKLRNVWCSESTVKRIYESYPDSKSVLCHGARNGKEVEWFIKHFPDACVTGTDISPTANEITNMFEWDFHDRKEEWVGQWDIVYSNSFDHSIYPEKCLKTWTDQLSETGVLFIELMIGDNNSSCRMDPLEISKSEVSTILDTLGFTEECVYDINATHGDSQLLEYKRK